MIRHLTRGAPSATWWAIACIALLSVVAAACSSSGDDDSSVAALDDSAASDEGSEEPEGDAEEEVLEWTECMRDQGLDIPDPEVDADGNLTFGGSPGGGGPPGGGGGDGEAPEFDRQEIEDAMEECGELPQGAFGFEDVDMTELQDTMLEYAQCMRDNGYDMPDPDFSGDGLGQTFADNDPEDPAFQAANEACEDIFAGIRPGGGDDASEEG